MVRAAGKNTAVVTTLRCKNFSIPYEQPLVSFYQGNGSANTAENFLVFPSCLYRWCNLSTAWSTRQAHAGFAVTKKVISTLQGDEHNLSRTLMQVSNPLKIESSRDARLEGVLRLQSNNLRWGGKKCMYGNNNWRSKSEIKICKGQQEPQDNPGKISTVKNCTLFHSVFLSQCFWPK